jgi:hypothetical protein
MLHMQLCWSKEPAVFKYFSSSVVCLVVDCFIVTEFINFNFGNYGAVPATFGSDPLLTEDVPQK